VRSAFLAAAAAALAASAMLAAAPARANGRFPASNTIVFSPVNQDLLLLRTTYGILPSYDYGTTWTWLCEDSLGLPPTSNEDPNIALTAGNAVVVGISHGLEVSPDTGCTWAFSALSGLAGQNVKDLVLRPDALHTVLAVTSTFEADAGTDGGDLYSQQVFATTDDGVTWAAQGTPVDPTVIVTTIEVAANDPQRIYVSAYKDVTPRTTWLIASTDGGMTWNEYPIAAFDPSQETAVYIAAVDPQNEDLVYVRSEGASRLFVSSDGGHTFQVAYSLQDQMLGFALSQDGSKVYLGGANTGLFMASRGTLQFQPVMSTVGGSAPRSIHVQCLATHGSDLWACSDEVSGFVAGVSQDDGATFTAKLHLNGISGPIACPAGTTAAQCNGALYQAMCANLGGCLEAGAGDGGAEAGPEGGTPGSTPSKSSCGCTVVGGGGAAGAVVAALVALVAAGRRRRQ
jgi:MYXO-CTERM domain-containing protein